MIQAVQNLSVELPLPAQSAQNCTASSPAKSFGKVREDVFEAHGLQDKEPKAENADPALMGLLFLTRAVQTEDVSTENEQTELSKCSGPAEGIAGILEGFGLLNADGSLTSEAAELLEAAYNAAAAEEPAVMPSAGMPPHPLSEQTPEGSLGFGEQGLPTSKTPRDANALIALLTPLAGNFIRSLENAHSPTAAEASPVQAAESADENGAAVLGKLMAAIQAALGEKNTAAASAAPAQPAVFAAPSDDAAKTPQAPLNTAAELQTLRTPSGAALQETPAAQETSGMSASETVMDLVDSLSTKAAEGTQEFEITLKPEHLGKLSIKLTQDGDGIKAHIKAADAAVRNMLSNETASLQTMLKEKGIAVTQIDVTYEASSSLAFSGGQPYRQQKNDAQESKGHHTVSGVLRASAYSSLTETPADDLSAATSARLVLQGSSVEFSA